jgi:hypothetical protein
LFCFKALPSGNLSLLKINNRYEVYQVQFLLAVFCFNNNLLMVCYLDARSSFAVFYFNIAFYFEICFSLFYFFMPSKIGCNVPACTLVGFHTKFALR